MVQTPKVKGPASYFPSIEKTYGEPIAHWDYETGQHSQTHEAGEPAQDDAPTATRACKRLGNPLFGSWGLGSQVLKGFFYLIQASSPRK